MKPAREMASRHECSVGYRRHIERLHVVLVDEVAGSSQTRQLGEPIGRHVSTIATSQPGNEELLDDVGGHGVLRDGLPNIQIAGATGAIAGLIRRPS